MEIKKSEDGYKKIAEEVKKALEHNASVDNSEDKIKQTILKISKGLLFTGAISIRDNFCKYLGIKPYDAPFTTDTDWDRESRTNFRLIITYK